ncbi:BQ5605_C002g01171 [Microbotryum silenes-dioicae]|uniref:BQ5605_C002g01171 protein n=1 Tax=Microbotryum silenes-dioicae TaxID=796604 RepID=A0A2X0M1W1_9BASI|nr:BQ5605_C002g01171 [Microbotryum silenes-dioicae]
MPSLARSPSFLPFAASQTMSAEGDEYYATFNCCENVSFLEDAEHAPPLPSSFRFAPTPHQDSNPTSITTFSSPAPSQGDEFDDVIHLWSDFNITQSPLEHGLGTAPLRIDSTRRSSHARTVSASLPRCVSVPIFSRPASFHAQPARRPLSLAFPSQPRMPQRGGTIKTETVPLKVRVTNFLRVARDRTIGGISKRKPKRSLIATSRRKKETFDMVEARQARLSEPELMHRVRTPRSIRRQPAPSLDEPMWDSLKSVDSRIRPRCSTSMGEPKLAVPNLSRHRSLPTLFENFTSRSQEKSETSSFVTLRRHQSSFFSPSTAPESAKSFTSGRAPLRERNMEGFPPSRYYLPSRKMSPLPLSEVVEEVPKFDSSIGDPPLGIDWCDEDGSGDEGTAGEGTVGEEFLFDSWEERLLECYQRDSLPTPEKKKRAWARAVDLGSDDEDSTTGNSMGSLE